MCFVLLLCLVTLSGHLCSCCNVELRLLLLSHQLLVVGVLLLHFLLRRRNLCGLGFAVMACVVRAADDQHERQQNAQYFVNGLFHFGLRHVAMPPAFEKTANSSV